MRYLRFPIAERSEVLPPAIRNRIRIVQILFIQSLYVSSIAAE
jgi:hypothetical protein